MNDTLEVVTEPEVQQDVSDSSPKSTDPETPTVDPQPPLTVPMSQPSNTPVASPPKRPRRNVKLPKHFQNFDIKMPNISGSQ